MATKVFTDTEIGLKCVDENEILYNTGEDYIRRIKGEGLECPEEMFEEILRNIEICEKVLLLLIKQRTILHESRMRFKANNDISGIQAEIAKSNLSQVCKDYLRDVSQLGYESLKSEKFFKHFVEFDTERLSNVAVHGKTVKMVCHFDMVALMDDIPTSTKQDQNSAEMTKKELTTKTKLINKNCKPERKGKTDSNRKSATTKKEVIGDSKDLESKNDGSADLNRVVVRVILTARGYVKALDVFRQLIYSKLLNVTHFYLLVYHIGPLVEEQQLVLYEYIIPSEIQTLLTTGIGNDTIKPDTTNDQLNEVPFTVSQTVHKSAFLKPGHSHVHEEIKPCDFDVSQLEAMFRKVKGRSLQQASAMKDYFRYLVYDTPGVKNHRHDAEARYERYVHKQEQKKLKKKKIKKNKLDQLVGEKHVPTDEEHIQFIESRNGEDIDDTKLGDCGSSLHISELTYRQVASTVLDN